ncbi:24059_t:CDS:2 [Cetraspora pellucida]|uniref:24059_t:CDS:1 n=1 Tax=Cetraspora pellucida TaxID=1433469 RepID=A0A9N9IA04_9GLOM|nr:24059_t:CDS:2 [Cetraspora pellucida]
MSEHKHLPNASHVEVVKAIIKVKKRASQSKEKLVQLIQNYMATLSEDVKPFLPSHNALRKTVEVAGQITSKSLLYVYLPAPELGEYGTAEVGIILNDNLKVGNLTISS